MMEAAVENPELLHKVSIQKGSLASPISVLLEAEKKNTALENLKTLIIKYGPAKSGKKTKTKKKERERERNSNSEKCS